MQPRQEVLRCIREQTGNRRVSHNTGLAELAEDVDGGLEQMVDVLQQEFGVELPEDEVLAAETVGDLCGVVGRAMAGAAQPLVEYDDPSWQVEDDS